MDRGLLGALFLLFQEKKRTWCFVSLYLPPEPLSLVSEYVNLGQIPNVGIYIFCFIFQMIDEQRERNVDTDIWMKIIIKHCRNLYLFLLC